MSQKFRAKLPYSAAHGVTELIHHILEQTKPDDDETKLLLAALNEVRLRIYTKLGSYQKEYKITFSPAQAIALRLLYTAFVDDATSYLGNQLHRLANDIHRWSA